MSFKESLFSICPEHRQIEPVDTPAGRTYVRALTVAEKDDFDKDVQESGGVSRPYILIHFCCKEDGSAEFDGFDINRINRMPAGIRVILLMSKPSNSALPSSLQQKWIRI